MKEKEHQPDPKISEWNAQLQRIRGWSFQDWWKPDFISSQGQSYSGKQTINGRYFLLYICRFHGSVRIDLLETDKGNNYIVVYNKFIAPKDESEEDTIKENLVVSPPNKPPEIIQISDPPGRGWRDEFLAAATIKYPEDFSVPR